MNILRFITENVT